MGALKRLTWYFLALAVVLLLVFRVLPALGILGPGAEELIQSAADAAATATDYGAPADQAQLVAALARLEDARRVHKAGETFKARRAALQARELAVTAQRAALVERESDRRQARKAVDAIDEALNRLEELHATASRGADRETLKRLLSVMKKARSTGAALFLAFEQGNYRKVTDEEPGARVALEAAGRELEAAARRR